MIRVGAIGDNVAGVDREQETIVLERERAHGAKEGFTLAADQRALVPERHEFEAGRRVGREVFEL